MNEGETGTLEACLHNPARTHSLHMKTSTTAMILAAVMSGASVASIAARPAPRTASALPALTLETAVPKAFGDWTLLPDSNAQVINPQVADELSRIYSQILSRTYVHKDGYRVMLSMAYGDDQRGGLQAHRPEVCYPGQGFQLAGMKDGTLPTAFGVIDVRRLQTSLGTRKEPITYWLTVGDEVVNGQFNKRVAEIKLALTGKVPDGLLFRISSIDGDTARAYARQQAFADDLLSAVPPKARKQLSGLAASGEAG